MWTGGRDEPWELDPFGGERFSAVAGFVCGPLAISFLR